MTIYLVVSAYDDDDDGSIVRQMCLVDSDNLFKVIKQQLNLLNKRFIKEKYNEYVDINKDYDEYYKQMSHKLTLDELAKLVIKDTFRWEDCCGFIKILNSIDNINSSIKIDEKGEIISIEKILIV